MRNDESEPLIGSRFRVEIEGMANAAAVEVVFPEARIAAARGKRLVRYGPLILRRGLTRSNDWYQWWDRARGSPSDVNRWTFLKAVPTAYGLSPLNALASAPLIETLELSVRGFEAGFDIGRES